MQKVTTATIGGVDDHDEEIGYTQTLRNIRRCLDDIYTKLSSMCTELEDMGDWVADADDLSNDDRENLLANIDIASDALCSLRNECYDYATGAIDVVLDAFERLTMTE